MYMHHHQPAFQSFLTKFFVLFAAVTALPVLMYAQAKNVDNFKYKKLDVAVFFYDPLDSLLKVDKDFPEKTDKEKSTALDKYEHEHPLYLFRLTSSKTKDITFLCIRGNPAKEGTKMFYKLEVIKNEPADFNPNDTTYANNIVQTIDETAFGGELFESMSLFDSPGNKKYIGNGIQLFGYYRMVEPYANIKAAIEDIIKQLSL